MANFGGIKIKTIVKKLKLKLYVHRDTDREYLILKDKYLDAKSIMKKIRTKGKRLDYKLLVMSLKYN